MRRWTPRKFTDVHWKLPVGELPIGFGIVADFHLRKRLRQRRHVHSIHDTVYTVNVGRLTPKGGVVYRTGRVNTARIKDTEMYKTHRWPRRDKAGPTLAGILHDLWEIT